MKMPNDAASPSPMRPWGCGLLAVSALVAHGMLAVALAVLRVIKGVPHFNPDKVDDITLGLLALPVLLQAVRQAQSFRVGRDGVEFTRRAEEKLDAAARDLAFTNARMARVARRSRATLEAARAARLAVAGVGGLPAAVGPDATGTAPGALTPRSTGSAANDRRGLWGGEPRAHGRSLQARVMPVEGTTEWFRVRLWVEALPGAPTLTDPVVFHLPPEFRPQDPGVAPVRRRAAIERLAYGPFIVGAETDGGRTRLELDLGTIHDAPRGFARR